MKKLFILSIATASLIFVSAQQEKIYKSVKIGTHEWMSENLDVTTYSNGDPIPEVQSPKEWKRLKTGAWCYYENKTENGGIVLSKLDDVINWARSNSLWPLTFATSCCGIEMMAVASAKYDFSRFGFEVARATPRQADVIIIAGTIVNKMAPVLKRLYDQMADPKYVIAMGACAISGGPFFYNTYSVVKGADHVIPVDVYIPGCPPRPEALLHALISLQDKIKMGMTREQIKQSV